MEVPWFQEGVDGLIPPRIRIHALVCNLNRGVISQVDHDVVVS
jgi:hypothetical protein